MAPSGNVTSKRIPRGNIGASPFTRRPLGLRLILAYKFVKAPVMLVLAVWMTAAPSTVSRSLESLARELAEGGAIWVRVGAWIQSHLTGRVIAEAGALAWLDTVSTAIEGLLLLSGKSWAEWIVILGLAALVPIELLSLEHRPSLGRGTLLLVNAAIVVYLVTRRVRGKRVRDSADGAADTG